MRYGILGTTQVHTDDGLPMALGGSRLRALLAALALYPGRTRGADALIDEVWGEGPLPADAAGALQALVGRLRRAVGRDAVASATGGYRLCAEPDDVDLHRFERLAGEGDRALADGDPAKAAAVLDDALALWRGPALADLPGRAAPALRLERRHLAARRCRLAAAVALGQAAQALPALAELCAAHPLDEPLQALHLRALRAAGRPAEALAAYEDVRRTITTRLGTDPGPELRALHADLLRPTPLAPPAPGAPGSPGTTAAPAEAPHPAGPPPGGSPGPDAGPYPAPAADARPSAGPAAGAPAAPPSGTPGPVPGAFPGGSPGTTAAPAEAPHRAGPPSGGSPGMGAGSYPVSAPDARPSAGPAAGAPAVPQHGVPAPASGAFPGGSPGMGAGSYPVSAPDARPSAGPAAGAPHGTPDPDGPVPVRQSGGHPADVPHGWSPADRRAPYDARGGVPGNLRARLTSFVGREDELVLIREDLVRHRLVTLLGPGGAGKTRLSQEAAEVAARGDGGWPDGVWLAELAPVDDAGTVPEAVLTALGARETVVRGTAAEGLRAATDATALDPLARLAEHCAQRRMLLVLDNCEHVIDAAARLAETLLAHCPGVTVLATSREPLAVPGELVRPVDPLPDPVALRLFAERGAAARPGFRVEDDPAACAEICRRLDGLPLAIELAAARLRLLTPRGLADRLDDRFRLLTSGSRTVLPRQQTLRAVVDWSWDLLTAPERAVLRRLSVFSGGCGLPLAEEVCADDSGTGVHAADVAALLGSLVDKSLVVAAPAADGHMRYRLLETVGEYAGERLDEAGERAAVERRHLVAHRELARTADPLLRGPEQRAWLERLELEHDNLRSALRRAVAARDEQEALCLVLSLSWFWQLRDHRADARHWAEAAAALGPDPFAEPVTPARPLYVSCTEAPPPMEADVLEEARRGARLVMLGNADSDLRVINAPETQRLLRAVVTAYGDGLPQNCRIPGMMWFFAVLLSGSSDDLYGVVDSTIDRCRELGYAWELANALQLRAKLLNDSPDRIDQGIADADESLEIFRSLGDSWGVAEALSGRGEALEKYGRFAAAAADYREAIERVEELGAAGPVPMLRARLVEVLMEDDVIDAEEGERALRETLAGMERLTPDTATFVRLQLGVRVARSGRLTEAREILEELAGEFGSRAMLLFQGLISGLLGWIDTLQGRPEEALPKIRDALVKCDDPVAGVIAPHMMAVQLMHAAQAFATLGGEEHALRAARLLGAGVALRPSGFHVPAAEREVRAWTEDRARAALSAGAYERAYAEGGRLSMVEAVALV
ncbi:BTAD domain-containing putative transcriptional regulator [Streptomyces sp. NPDC046261]|uniref:BTAD domain-containing putative transcriptional regulator n=1 Tax=Streptomyces sp. NPDC046261 TaxID=3157200 RepID=UPI0033C83BAA